MTTPLLVAGCVAFAVLLLMQFPFPPFQKLRRGGMALLHIAGSVGLIALTVGCLVFFVSPATVPDSITTTVAPVVSELEAVAPTMPGQMVWLLIAAAAWVVVTPCLALFGHSREVLKVGSALVDMGKKAEKSRMAQATAPQKTPAPAPAKAATVKPAAPKPAAPKPAPVQESGHQVRAAAPQPSSETFNPVLMGATSQEEEEAKQEQATQTLFEYMNSRNS